MAEKEFAKTFAIKVEDFKELIDTEYSSVMLSKFPKNNHQVLKITKEPVMRCSKKKDSEEVNRNVTFFTTFKYKEQKVPIYMRVGESSFFRFAKTHAVLKEIKEDAYDEMNTKHISGKVDGVTTFFLIKEWKKEGFMNKYAFFSKTCTSMKINGKMKEVYPQFINVVTKEGFEPTEFKKTMDIIKEIDNKSENGNNVAAPVKIDTSNQVSDFVTNYKDAMEQYNSMAEKQNEKPKLVGAKDCMAKYMKQYHPEEYSQVVKNYKISFPKK